MKRKISLSLILISLLAVFAFTSGEKYFDIAKSLDIFATVFKEVNTYYVDEVEPKKLIETGIQGMLESLDPYTSYIPEEEMEAFSILTTGQYAGIGALIGIINKKAVVTFPYENFPAQRAGIHVGDEFISVDGKNVKGKPTSEITALLKGNPSSEIEIELSRMGKVLSFKLTREKIRIPNIAYQGIIGGDIGYIKLDDFTPGASKEVEEAVTTLKQKGAKGIIIDLKENPGGLLYEAINIVNLFIPKGKEVVATKGKVQDWNKSYTTLNNPMDMEIPLAILTSGGSASASEIVAGALQDYDRAVLIGQKTFGKGLVQTTRPLAFNAQLKVTTAKYYIPSGRCIQALDYTHRKNDGTVEKFADSLKSSFKTKSGRIVYDGAGLDPDIAVNVAPFGSAVVELIRSGMIFNYATLYCNTHTAPADFATFHIADKDYQQFGSWLKEQHFVYKTELDEETESLATAAKNERYYDELETSLNLIRSKVEQNHSLYLERFKSEIQHILEEEIAFHYSLNRGKAEVSISNDQEIKQAMTILHDTPAFKKLLMPH